MKLYLRNCYPGREEENGHTNRSPDRELNSVHYMGEAALKPIRTHRPSCSKKSILTGSTAVVVDSSPSLLIRSNSITFSVLLLTCNYSLSVSKQRHNRNEAKNTSLSETALHPFSLSTPSLVCTIVKLLIV